MFFILEGLELIALFMFFIPEGLDSLLSCSSQTQTARQKTKRQKHGKYLESKVTESTKDRDENNRK
jgi:hypothetical protein